MGEISKRVEGTIENWRKDYGGPLKNFAADFIGLGMEVGLNILGKSASDKLKPLIERIEKETKIPPELKPIFEELKNPTGEAAAIFGQQVGGSLLGSAIGKIVDYILRPLTLGLSYAPGYHINPPDMLIHLWLRGEIDDSYLSMHLHWLGMGDDDIDQLKKLTTVRLDPMSVITAWRREPKTYESLFDDLRHQGWTDDRIETLKFITQYIPGVQDVIRFGVREVYTPDIRKKFGLDEDFPDAIMPDADRIGLAKEELLKYWGAHWELPSPLQGFEMLRRGLIDEDTLMLLLRTLDIMPFWREKLMDISWEVPTRVDVRRFWDMRTIDEARLREIYTALGYHGRDLEDYVLWTKIFVDFPTLLARYKNGWITLDDVKKELVAMGMKPDRADIMIEEKIKKEAPERTATEKNLTKADIIAGVKKGVITREQGAELLVDLGYDNDEAIYLLAVNIPLDEEEKAVVERELTKSEILSGLKAGIITEGDARNKLLDLRYTAANAEFILSIYRAAVKPPEEPKLREVSKADIVTGVKKGLISNTEGYMMLQDIGFSPEASEFILLVQTTESPFSPQSFEEFKDITQKYRQATGREVKAMPEELKAAAEEVVRLTKDVEALKEAVKLEQEKLLPGEELPAAATARLKQLQVKLHRAEAELARTKSNYDRLVAEWRHSA